MGFNIGDRNLHIVLLGLFTFFLLLGWLMIWLRNRKYWL